MNSKHNSFQYALFCSWVPERDEMYSCYIKACNYIFLFFSFTGNFPSVSLQTGSNHENIFLLCPVFNPHHPVPMHTCHFHRSLLSHFPSFHGVFCYWSLWAFCCWLQWEKNCSLINVQHYFAQVHQSVSHLYIKLAKLKQFLSI